MGEDVTPDDSATETVVSPGGEDATEEEMGADPNEPTAADFAEAEIASQQRQDALAKMSWRRRTATGAILSGLALGFQQVFEDAPREPSIVIETSGAPPKDLPVEAELEEFAPRRSVVKIRPWLLDEDEDEVGGATDADVVEGRAADPTPATPESKPEG